MCVLRVTHFTPGSNALWTPVAGLNGSGGVTAKLAKLLARSQCSPPLWLAERQAREFAIIL
jgi:hypothetical protein